MVEIIAEIGQNHWGDIDLAKELIFQAKKNGADVVKFQLFSTDKIFSPSDIWYWYSKKAELTYLNTLELMVYCDELKIEFMASVFDLERLKWLEKLKVKRYKIASRSIHDAELINAIIKTKKPIIASLGMWEQKTFPKFKADFLYCVSEYPAYNIPIESINFGKNNYTGFSDHSIGIEIAKKAIDRGAKIIEKHFTFDKNAYGPDHVCSMTSKELKELRNYCA